MSSYVTLVIFVLVIIGLLSFSARAKRRQAAALAERAESIGVGSAVMTTSGLYGTVTGRNDDDSVQLTIAPGVEVRWALAALREVASLPPELRGGDAARADDTDDWSGVGVRMDKTAAPDDTAATPNETFPGKRDTGPVNPGTAAAG